MSDITIYGPPQSSYVRTVRMVCEEKGASYELSPVQPGTEASLALHPFGKVPAVKHGDVHIYETSAIARYIDEVFPGPSLLPPTAVERAAMERWISTINAYMYDDLVRKYVLAYVFPKGADGKPDRAAIEAALPNVRRDLHIIDKGLAGQDWLAGKAFSLADIFLAPILSYVAMFPEGAAVLADCNNMRRVGAVMTERPSYKKTVPALPGA